MYSVYHVHIRRLEGMAICFHYQTQNISHPVWLYASSKGRVHSIRLAIWKGELTSEGWELGSYQKMGWGGRVTEAEETGCKWGPQTGTQMSSQFYCNTRKCRLWEWDGASASGQLLYGKSQTPGHGTECCGWPEYGHLPNFPISSPHTSPTSSLPAPHVSVTLDFLKCLEWPYTFCYLWDFVCVLPSVQSVFFFPLCLDNSEEPFKTKLKYQFLWKPSLFGSHALPRYHHNILHLFQYCT